MVTWEADGPARRIYPPPTTNLFGPNGVFRGQAWVVPRWLRREARRRLRAHGYLGGTSLEPPWRKAPWRSEVTSLVPRWKLELPLMKRGRPCCGAPSRPRRTLLRSSCSPKLGSVWSPVARAAISTVCKAKKYRVKFFRWKERRTLAKFVCYVSMATSSMRWLSMSCKTIKVDGDSFSTVGGKIFQVKTRQNSREFFLFYSFMYDQRVMAFDELRSIKKVDREKFPSYRVVFFR